MNTNPEPQTPDRPKPKPFLEKSTSKAKKQVSLSKAGRIGLLVFLALLLLVFPLLWGLRAYRRSREVRVPYPALAWPRFSADTFKRIQGSQTLPEFLLTSFSQEGKAEGPAYEALQLEAANPDQLAGPQVLQACGVDLTLEDQLLKLKFLLAQGARGPFEDLREKIQEDFPQLGKEGRELAYWDLHLAYVRVLLLARQTWPDPDLDRDLEAWSARLLPVFAEGPPPLAHETLRDKTYPLVSGLDQEEGGGEEVAYLELARIDLWVLQALSAYDPGWQPVFDHWLAIIQEARLDSGFYAYAWTSDQKAYIPSDTYSFRANTGSSLTQAIRLYEVGQGQPEDLVFFNQILARSGLIYDYYNLASGEPMTTEASCHNLLALAYLARLADQDLAAGLAQEQGKDQEEEGQENKQAYAASLTEADLLFGLGRRLF